MVLVAEHYHTWWVTLPAATMIGVKLLSLRCASGWRNWETQQRGGLVDWQSENDRADGGAGLDAVASKRLG
jgi:hypothetical protein